MFGSDGRPAPAVNAGGGATTFTTKALWPLVLADCTTAAKTRWVESGSHAGDPSSPDATVVVVPDPTRFLTRRLVAPPSFRKYAIRFPDGAQLISLTAPVSAASKYRALSPTSYPQILSGASAPCTKASLSPLGATVAWATSVEITWSIPSMDCRCKTPASSMYA